MHFLQIWIIPEREGLSPGYEQKTFEAAEKRGRLRLIASHGGRDGSVAIHQDADLYATLLEAGETVSHALKAGRGAWVQVARGSIAVNGHRLDAGDGMAIEGAGDLRLEANQRGGSPLRYGDGSFPALKAEALSEPGSLLDGSSSGGRPSRPRSAVAFASRLYSRTLEVKHLLAYQA